MCCLSQTLSLIWSLSVHSPNSIIVSLIFFLFFCYFCFFLILVLSRTIHRARWLGWVEELETSTSWIQAMFFQNPVLLQLFVIMPLWIIVQFDTLDWIILMLRFLQCKIIFKLFKVSRILHIDLFVIWLNNIIYLLLLILFQIPLFNLCIVIFGTPL